MPIQLILESHEKDLGGFKVSRSLPSAKRRMVGPFIFIDHMGPALIQPPQEMTVRPHPHIGLSTLTYLFAGQIQHRDSLGSNQVITPGAINWMTAGRGIVHSERTPDHLKKTSQQLHGLQCWVALPNELEDCPPSFQHFAKESLPVSQSGTTILRILMGQYLGMKSPAQFHSDLYFAEIEFPERGEIQLPADSRELGIYVVQGACYADGSFLSQRQLGIWNEPPQFSITGEPNTRIILLGGRPVGHREIWWNLVASSKEKLAEAKEDWKKGPRSDSPRFHKVPGDEIDFIPSPES